MPAFHRCHYVFGVRGNLRREHGDAQSRRLELDAIRVQKALKHVRSDGEVHTLRDFASRLRQKCRIVPGFDKTQEVSAGVEYWAAASQLNYSR